MGGRGGEARHSPDQGQKNGVTGGEMSVKGPVRMIDGAISLSFTQRPGQNGITRAVVSRWRGEVSMRDDGQDRHGRDEAGRGRLGRDPTGSRSLGSDHDDSNLVSSKPAPARDQPGDAGSMVSLRRPSVQGRISARPEYGAITVSMNQ